MKLYYSKGACSLAVRIAIHEMGLSCQFESVDLKTKKTETGTDYLTINPKGSVPALLIDKETLITEGAVIQQYLADVHHAYHMLPKVGELARYHVLEWLNFVATDLHKGFGPLFNSKISSDLKENIFKPNIKRALALVEKQLSNQPYLYGDSLTIADCYLFVILSWFPHFDMSLSEWSFTQQYFDRLYERKAFQQSLKEEDLLTKSSGNQGAACSIK